MEILLLEMRSEVIRHVNFLKCIAIAATLGSVSHEAGAVVHQHSVQINIPNIGVYLNVVSGAQSVGPVAGWTFNPWGVSGLIFWVNGSPVDTEHIIREGGGAVARLSGNEIVGPTPVYGGWSDADLPAMTTGNQPWTLNSSLNYYGFRFRMNGAWHYGWARIQLGSSLTASPRAIVEYAWEDQPNMPLWFYIEPFGVCCRGSTCQWTTRQDCLQFNPGVWMIGTTNCSLSPCPCQADIAPHGPFNGDGVIDMDDLLLVMNHWGPCTSPWPGTCQGDATYDGLVDVDDLLRVINNWGQCPG